MAKTSILNKKLLIHQIPTETPFMQCRHSGVLTSFLALKPDTGVCQIPCFYLTLYPAVEAVITLIDAVLNIQFF